jgi:hypothetical protein
MNPETDCQDHKLSEMPAQHLQKEITLSKKVIDFIILKEITSIDWYNKRLIYPTWPKGDSGVTIGIGYDLGYNTRIQISQDWGGRIAPKDLQYLLAVAGLKREAAKDALDASALLRAVKVPYIEAHKVFVKSSVPRYLKMALAIYPELGDLKPDAATALLSMVFNRGNGLEGDRRREMRNIVPLVAAQDYDGIADQIEASKRLWVGKNLDGLVTRREKEAKFVREAIRDYKPEDLITILL